jgi:8-oxo-dGTP pyrophosphatase MutT (NUDIX family)
MYLKIFINEKPIYLADNEPNRLQNKINEGFDFYDDNTYLDYDKIIDALKDDNKMGAVIIQKNLTALKSNFFGHFIIIEAGGGIVQNDDKDLLFIFRNGKWDLPKGKLEPNETIEICAQREVEEETGVTNLNLKKKIGETYHIYQEKNKQILKISHWFYFTTANTKNITAQTEEGITEVKWVATKDIKIPMANTYQNIKEILSTFFDTP